MNRFFPLLVAASVFAVPAFAQNSSDAKPGAAAIDTKAFDDWVVRCPTAPKAMPCDAVQLLLEPESKQRVLSVSVAYDGAKKSHVVRIVLPLGVWLPSGVTIVAGETKIEKVVVRRCEPFGCVVEGLLDPALRESMRKGGEAKIVVFDQAQKPLDLKFSLKGYAGAEDHMTAETKKLKPAAEPAPSTPAQP
jgi:invasion protein IalB